MDTTSALTVQVQKVEQSLWRSPTDEETIIQCFSEGDNRALASVLLGGFVSMQKQMLEIKTLLAALASNKSNTATATDLGMFFTMESYKYLLEDFSLVKDKVAYKGKVCTEKDSTILQLSIKMEDFFGSKDIHFSNLLKGMRRALTKRDNSNPNYKEFLAEELGLYFNSHKKAKRIRFKNITNLFVEINGEVSEEDIKVWLEELGYHPKPDMNRVLWYTNK